MGLKLIISGDVLGRRLCYA